jgi:uncharacterized glyoxalase superfamily protein PhnB
MARQCRHVKVPWGGCNGYFRDPDGHFWKVAYWDEWEFNREGSLVIE